MSKHKEAFALMWYACPCGHRERIWNSRDGVTPFGGLLCASCGGKGLEERGLSHVDFGLDEPSPDHKLRDGQLFFRDGTPGDAIAIIKRRIRIFEMRGQPIPSDIAARLLEDARNSRGEWLSGWPMVDRYSTANRTMVERWAGDNPEPPRNA